SAECPRNVFAPRSGQNELLAQDPSKAAGVKPQADHRSSTCGEQPARVRERSTALRGHQERQGSGKRPAHHSNRLVAQLNETWRILDDPLQWLLQRRKGNPRTKNSGWENRSFCTTRDALLRCIREYCCSPDEGQSRCIHEYRGVSPVALQQVRALPERHLDWAQTDEFSEPTSRARICESRGIGNGGSKTCTRDR